MYVKQIPGRGDCIDAGHASKRLTRCFQIKSSGCFKYVMVVTLHSIWKKRLWKVLLFILTTATGVMCLRVKWWSQCQACLHWGPDQMGPSSLGQPCYVFSACKLARKKALHIILSKRMGNEESWCMLPAVVVSCMYVLSTFPGFFSWCWCHQEANCQFCGFA